MEILFLLIQYSLKSLQLVRKTTFLPSKVYDLPYNTNTNTYSAKMRILNWQNLSVVWHKNDSYMTFLLYDIKQHYAT